MGDFESFVAHVTDVVVLEGMREKGRCDRSLMAREGASSRADFAAALQRFPARSSAHANLPVHARSPALVPLSACPCRVGSDAARSSMVAHRWMVIFVNG